MPTNILLHVSLFSYPQTHTFLFFSSIFFVEIRRLRSQAARLWAQAPSSNGRQRPNCCAARIVKSTLYSDFFFVSSLYGGFACKLIRTLTFFFLPGAALPSNPDLIASGAYTSPDASRQGEKEGRVGVGGEGCRCVYMCERGGLVEGEMVERLVYVVVYVVMYVVMHVEGEMVEGLVGPVAC